MKKLLLALALLASIESFATHIIGGEIIYQHMGGSSYLLTCKLYRDCCPTCFDFPASVQINVRRGNGTQPTPKLYTLPFQGRTILDPPIDTCAFDPGICVEEAIFSAVVSLPPGTGGYHLWMSSNDNVSAFPTGLCCRNNSIDNISTPGSMNETFYAYVPDNNVWLTNSSPVIANFPPVFVCQGYDLDLDFSATDADGDDLVYSFYTPYNNLTGINGLGTPPDNVTFSTVNWLAGYSATDPLDPTPGSVPGLTIDANGHISGIPPIQGQFVVGVMIEEYRDGVKIGKITRDFQFNVLNCPPPQDAGIGAIDGCSGTNISFINASGSGANGFWWDFGTGNPADTSVVFEPTFNYGAMGTYPITLMAQKGTLCADTAYYSLIISGMNADFTAPDTVCIGEAANFNDISTSAFNGVVNQWEWDFGDSQTSTLQNPSHTYTASGLQTVQLIAHTTAGCADTITKQLYVKVPPQAAITALPGCNGLNVNFDNNSDLLASGFWWDFGTSFPADTSVSTNPTFDYSAYGYGSYTVTLIAQKGTTCADTTTYNLMVSNVVADFADLDTTCTNVLINYIDQSTNTNGTITQWQWNFGDFSTTTLQNPTHGYSVAGDYNVQLIVTSSIGCKDTIVKPIHVDDAPQAIIGATDFCSGSTINFVNNSTSGANGFWWDFGTGNPADSSILASPSFTYPGFGNYTVTLIAQKGTVCETSTTLPITISDLIPDFDLPAGSCVGSTVSFINQSSTSAGTSITGYGWDFGDMSTSTLQDPTHTYTTGGSMPVQLVVTNNVGCSDTIVQNLNIQSLPIADAGPDTAVCVSNPGLELSGIVTGATGGVWTPNGGALVPSATNLNATYFPSLAEMNNGSTQLILTTTGNGDCPAQTDTIQILYLDTPDINTGGDIDVCEDSLYVQLNASVQFAANIIWSTNGAGSFDDASQLNATYTFDPADVASGQITLYIETFNFSGCPDDQDSLYIIFNQPPTMSLVYDDTICAGFPLQLVSNSSTGNGWWQTSGDGTFAPDDSAATAFYNHGTADETNGTVDIYFQTIDNGGCNALYDTLTLAIVPSPTPGFTFVESCFGLPTVFTNTSTSVDPISGYAWSFETGGTSTQTDPVYTFVTPGIHNVEMIVTSANGCTDTLIQPVNAHYIPVASFDLPAPCLPGGTYYYDASTVTGDSIASWSWNFGDGGTSTIQDPVHQYSSSQGYTVVLTVTSGFGCSDDTTANVTILPGPTADFDVNPSSANLYVDLTFTDQSVPNGSPLDQWLWNFADGDSSSLQNPVHQYDYEGEYDIELIVIDEAGCRDTAYLMVPIYHGPLVPSAFSPNGDNNNDWLMVLGGNFETLDFKIYNNWGQVIFETQDPLSMGWNGIFKDEPQPMGVYVYVAKVTTYDGVEHVLSGDVSLIR
ncbi:MAG: PKD domain-containing protein [Bacteroidetes bacterium]|nr:PKD domain-containing protein [Bacteroidota bacterium]